MIIRLRERVTEKGGAETDAGFKAALDFKTSK
jgi:hypothetical protein